MIAAKSPDHDEALAQAAERFVGAPFRLHGREPATGLDCVGLVCATLVAVGARPDTPTGYGLRNLTVEHWLHHAARSGLVPSPGAIRRGNVLLVALGMCQHHLVITTSDGMVVHAHAGLRRVVRQPLEPTWQVCAKWRAALTTEG